MVDVHRGQSILEPHASVSISNVKHWNENDQTVHPIMTVLASDIPLAPTSTAAAAADGDIETVAN